MAVRVIEKNSVFSPNLQKHKVHLYDSDCLDHPSVLQSTYVLKGNASEVDYFSI